MLTWLAVLHSALAESIRRRGINHPRGGGRRDSHVSAAPSCRLPKIEVQARSPFVPHSFPRDGRVPGARAVWKASKVTTSKMRDKRVLD